MNIKGLALCLSSALLIPSLQAKPIDFTPGLSGGISLNAGINQTNSQFNTNDDNAITQDLNRQENKPKQQYRLFSAACNTPLAIKRFSLVTAKIKLVKRNFKLKLATSRCWQRNLPHRRAVWQYARHG